MSPAQGCPDERQILRRNGERVFVLIPAERRSQVLPADDQGALSIEVSPDVETITVIGFLLGWETRWLPAGRKPVRLSVEGCTLLPVGR